MEYGFLILLALAIPLMGIAGFFMALSGGATARQLGEELAALRNRLAGEMSAREKLEARIAALEGGTPDARTIDMPLPRAEPPVSVDRPPVAEPPPTTEPPPVTEAFQPETPAAPTSVPAVTPSSPSATSAPQDLENWLGARWAVWIGGLALALGGVFLVRYTIEQGLIGPAGRVALGGLLSACLIAAGEWLRRNEGVLDIPAQPQAYIPGVLTAAGSSTAFATVFAAHALYELIGTAPAFILLGLVSLATLAASLLHGPWLAGLGVLAAYATPFFVASGAPNEPAMFLYLSFITATATALGRLRAWMWLVATAHAAAIAWAFVLLMNTGDPDELLYGLYALALALITVGPRIVLGSAEGGRALDYLGTILAAGHSVVMLVAVVSGRFEDPVLTVALVFLVVHLAAAWRSADLGPLVALAGLLAAAVLGAWDIPLTVDPTGDILEQLSGKFLQVNPESVDRFISCGTMLGALFLVFGLRGAWRGAASAWLAGGAAIVPFALLAIGYARIAAFEPSLSFAFVALGLAIVLAGAAEASRLHPPPSADVVTALFAAGCVAALCLGISVILEKGWLTVALALLSLGLAWIEQRRPVPVLRVLAVGVAGLVVLRLFWYPLVTEDPGATPVFNWLLWGYGVPAVAFAWTARLFRRTRDDFATHTFEGLAVAYTTLTFSLQIRHFATGGEMFQEATLIEAGLQTSLALGLSLALQRLHERVPSPVFAWASRAIGYASLAMIMVWLGLVANPIISGDRIDGTLLINELLVGYLLPSAIAGLLALERLRSGENDLAKFTAALSLALSFAWVSLNVRLGFHGPELAFGPVSSNELYAYSAAWLFFAMALLGTGLIGGYRWFRLASAVVLGPTVLKVFIIDMAHLEGVLRATSFLGLGLVLIGIGLLYQRLLTRSRLRA